MKLTKENNMNYAIRHGEVFLLPVDKAPKGKSEKHTTFIVGHSEIGHQHGKC